MEGGMDASSGIVRAEGLTKQVATPDHVLTIVRDATFTVRPGEAVAILGASGSGKSTLLGLLAGLDVPTSGRVWIGAEELFALDEDGRARLRGQHVGFVFQSFQLLPALTALENVMLPLELAGGADAAARARGVLERVGLGERLGIDAGQRDVGAEPVDQQRAEREPDTLLQRLGLGEGTEVEVASELFGRRCHRALRSGDHSAWVASAWT